GPGVPDHCATISQPDLRGAVLELEAGGRMAQASARSVAKLRSWLDEREAALTAFTRPVLASAPPTIPLADSQEIR
ncbi:MAG: hypothetical protein Q7T55_13480, partial [Solirubrobacteraceae bacterium]|nr:hypothetical protein [Solirubrobacteraceae bacterium]